MKNISEFVKRQNFQPNLLSLFLNPTLFLRRAMFREIRSKSSALTGKLLDFGCGRKPFANLFQVSEYIGVDIQVSGHDNQDSPVDVYYDGKTLPFSDDTFDSMFCCEVLEHVFNPEEILAELRRVMKPGATGLITVPFAWPEHEQPYDYARYSSFGIRHLLEKHGFEVISVDKSGHHLEVVWQLGIFYILAFFHTENRVLNTILTALLISPFNLLGSMVCAVAPRKRDLFFNSIVLVRNRKK